jgi:hypothetical protein
MFLVTDHSMKVTMEMLFLSLVPGRSQVIALRRSYDDGCRRQQFRWSLAKTWSRLSRHRVVYMIVHIHVTKEGGRSQNLLARRVLLQDTRVSHMEIDCKEKKAPKMTKQISLVDHSSNHQEESVEPKGPTDESYHEKK